MNLYEDYMSNSGQICTDLDLRRPHNEIPEYFRIYELFLVTSRDFQAGQS